MATAVEMTITLGRTLWGARDGETDTDETIEGRETRVSVTWRLTEGDQNLPLTASLLAEKTVQVLETADRTIRCRPEPPSGEERVPALSQPPSSPAAEAPLTHQAAAHHEAAAHGLASTGSTPAVDGTRGNGFAPRSYTTAVVPRITRAQSLAIGSLCTRHGVADWELRRLVWEQFGKKEQSELTKEQAGELLNILQQNAASDETHNHAYA